MKKILARIIALTLLAISCGGGAISSNEKASRFANDWCDTFNHTCVGADLKEKVGVNLEGFYWGANFYGEVELEVLPEITVNLRTPPFACFDEGLCAQNTDLCGGVLFHEFGHTFVGSNQIDADCWAYREAHARGVPEFAGELTIEICSWGYTSIRCLTLTNGCPG